MSIKLSIEKTEDWYHVTVQQLKETGKFPGNFTLQNFMEIVSDYYIDLDISIFKNVNYKKSQTYLKNMLNNIFSGKGENFSD